MPLRRLARQAREVWEVPRDLVLGRYPAFVTGGPLPKGHVPVFVFHSLEAESFGRKLQHLADNGYVTLSATEYFQFLMGTRPAPERAVVLTFDDGRGSLWSVGYPLMRRLGMKGIVFLVPGRMGSRPGPPAPTWDDVPARPGLLRREEGDGAFLSWEEVDTLLRCGLFDFQSHTFSHARVHTGGRLAGFVTPGLQRGYAAMDVPLIELDGRLLSAAEVPLGTPFFQSEPRTSETLRFREEPSVRRACTARVSEEGARFFDRKDWPQHLERLLPGGPRGVAGTREAPEERERAIRHELLESKRRIEERTGQEVIHLCYPWHVAGPTARTLAREIGYRTAFGGKVPGTPLTLSGADPHAIARIGEDYVELLPGRGRATLSEVLARKWRRRVRGRA
jgi:peptidoglycan/xylan/chitin deacetylase (PgdA/CDA1 family)